MCLLVAVSGIDPDAPLVIGANRDERLDRPATALDVLQRGHPRILGGRDHEAGGTWLAVNEHGVVAGLTNRPSPGGRDPRLRSRGELPLALAGHRQASGAVDDFVARFRPWDYNPAWLLVGDRSSLYALDMTGDADVRVEVLTPGVHILENNPLHAPSAKVVHVRALIGDVAGLGGDALVERLRGVLVDHSRPHADGAGADDDADGVGRPVETLAACVHTDTYGTRSSTIVRVPAGAGAPVVLVADGHPCTSAYVDGTSLWGAVRPEA